MADENTGSAIVTFDEPAPQVPMPVPTGHDEGSVDPAAELIGAADFIARADRRDPVTAQIAAEIDEMLGERGINNPFTQEGEGQSGPQRDENGRFVSRSVPHAAMHKERARRKEAEAKAQRLEIEKAKLEERFQLLQEMAAQTEQQLQPRQYNDGEIDPEIDIFEAVRQLQKQTAQQKQAANIERFNTAYRQDALQVSKQHPDLLDAYKHLAETRDRELQVMGIADPEQRRTKVAQEEQQLVLQALQAGGSPALTLYELAKARGYRPAGNTGAQRFNFAPDARAIEQIQHAQRGQAAAASFTGAGGSPAPDGLSVAQLANMDEDAFDRLIQKMGGLGSDKVRRAFGG